ncbi:MAG: ribonuclease HII, partial [Clostridia bacterium]|nr:ribonuclease HII [Clostridia bacterium]
MEKLYNFEVGIDEAGRGCLSGPVVAGSFFIPPSFKPHKYLNDSKQMTESQRETVYHWLKENYFEYGSAGVISAQRIDEVNILQATFDAMHAALDLNLAFQQSRDKVNIIVDGDKFRAYGKYTYECIPKADAKFYSVAAASVIAKVTRDHIMIGLHAQEKYNC